MARIQVAGCDILIETDCFSASVATRGYTSGVKAGTFRDRRTGAVDPGFGLDIVDFLLEPGQGEGQDPAMPYHFGDLYHGRIVKRYVEIPQICTQAGQLPYELFRGEGFVAVRQCFQWTRAARGYIAGSRWEQTLVFPDGQRYFFASDRVTTVNDCECLLLRTDLPGHLKHDRGDCFTSIYLSHVGEISSDRFLYDFPPDGDFLYRRAERAIQEHLIRAYRLRVGAEAGPWLGGITIDPADVYEAWCHQRGYVCFIQEIGGRKIRRDESFGADYAIGYFDSVEEMVVLARRLKGLKGLKVAGETESARWGWTEHGGG